MRGSFKDPRDLDGHLSVVEEKKQLLTKYAALINKTIEPFKATVFEILWARERCGQDIAAHQQSLAQVILPVVVRFTRAQFTQTEQFLSVYAQHLAAVLAPCNSIRPARSRPATRARKESMHIFHYRAWQAPYWLISF